VADALSIYEVDPALIRELRPTHIITQTQCKVCAVSLEDVERALRIESGVDAQVIALEPYALADLWTDIARIAAACGYDEAGEALTASLQARMREIETRAEGAGVRPSVAALEWLEPLMAAGNWVPELIEMAGGRNLFGVAGKHSPFMTFEQLCAEDPDCIVALPCGFDMHRTRAEMHWMMGRAGWEELRAVKSNRVYVCDGNQFMNRPGPRLLESLQIFAEILHPDLFEPKLRSVGWETFE
jgi:iron complex transport system substrate-binding protein